MNFSLNRDYDKLSTEAKAIIETKYRDHIKACISNWLEPEPFERFVIDYLSVTPEVAKTIFAITDSTFLKEYEARDYTRQV